MSGPSTTHRLVVAVRARGEQTAFYGRALFAIPDAMRSYPGEVLRVISQMGLGMGALALVGGSVAVMGFLTISTGALVAIQGFESLSDVGVLRFLDVKKTERRIWSMQRWPNRC